MFTKDQLASIIQTRYGNDKKTTGLLLSMLCLGDVKVVRPGETVSVHVAPGMSKLMAVTINGIASIKPIMEEVKDCNIDQRVVDDNFFTTIVVTARNELYLFFVSNTELIAAYPNVVMRDLLIDRLINPEILA